MTFIYKWSNWVFQLINHYRIIFSFKVFYIKLHTNISMFLFIITKNCSRRQQIVEILEYNIFFYLLLYYDFWSRLHKYKSRIPLLTTILNNLLLSINMAIKNKVISFLSSHNFKLIASFVHDSPVVGQCSNPR